MGVTHDYVCMSHGEFESDEEAPRCPQGCTSVKRVYNQAPSFKSIRTSNTDRMLEAMARQHGLTDMSNRGGRSVMENQRLREAVASKAYEGDQSVIENMRANPETANGAFWGKPGKTMAETLAKVGVRPENNMVNAPKPMPNLIAPDYKG